MQGDPSDLDPQQLWQSQPKEHVPMTLAAVHQQARSFEARIRRRNLAEYVGAALAIAGFLPAVFHRGSWMMQASGVLVIAGVIFVVWQLHRRGAARPLPEAGEALQDFYRAELVRQRDAARDVAVWYLAPGAPGIAMLLLARWFQSPATRWSLEADHIILALTAAVAALAFLAIWLLNQRGAQRLQRRIDELDKEKNASEDA